MIMSGPNGNTSNIIPLERDTDSIYNNDVVDEEEVELNEECQVVPEFYHDADTDDSNTYFGYGIDGNDAEAYNEEVSVPLRESDLVVAVSHPVEGEEGYIPTDNDNDDALNLNDYQSQVNEGRIVADSCMPVARLRGLRISYKKSETEKIGLICGGKNPKESKPLQPVVPGKKAVNKMISPIPNKPKLEKGSMYGEGRGRLSVSVSDDTDDRDDGRCVPSPSHNYLSPAEKEKRKQIPNSEKDASVKNPAPTKLPSTGKKTTATSGNSVSSDEPCLICQSHLLMGPNQVYVEAKWDSCKWKKINLDLDRVTTCLKRVHTSCRDTTVGLRGESVSSDTDNDYLCPSHI